MTDGDVLGFRAMLYMAFRGSSSRSKEETLRLARTNIDAALRADAGSFWANAVNYAYFGKVPASPEFAKRAAESRKTTG